MSAVLRGRNDSKAKSFARWPVFIIANAALLLVIGASTVRETYRGWTVDREIQALGAKAESLESRRSELETLAQELVSPERVEHEARARLGMKKPEERVIVLEGYSADVSSGNLASAGYSDRKEDLRSNPEKWKEYFFKEHANN